LRLTLSTPHQCGYHHPLTSPLTPCIQHPCAKVEKGGDGERERGRERLREERGREGEKERRREGERERGREGERERGREGERERGREQAYQMALRPLV
jgi:hypothetical protein